MCKDGQPCNEAGKDKTPITTDFFGRLEMLIVLAELHEAHAVDMPQAAVNMLDVIGPLLMDTMRKAQEWDGMQMAMEIIKQKRKLYERQGVEAPVTASEELVEMLADLVGKVKKRDKKNGTKP